MGYTYRGSEFGTMASRHAQWDSRRKRIRRHTDVLASIMLTESLPKQAPQLADYLSIELNRAFIDAAEIVAKKRPPSLRQFDQISMATIDLARQVKLVQPLLAGRRVVFMGDNDGASLVLGLLGVNGYELPSEMLLLDFDRRILANARAMAQQFGFSDRLDAYAYNAFEPVPSNLVGKYDVFYTNPPYGRANDGLSVRLFVARGMELCHSRGSACGCVILPDDAAQAWTRRVMLSTQSYILDSGWEVREKLNGLHRYELPNNPGLTSGMLWIDDVAARQGVPLPAFYGRPVAVEEITHFYGTKVSPPYPRFVNEDGSLDHDWTEGRLAA